VRHAVAEALPHVAAARGGGREVSAAVCTLLLEDAEEAVRAAAALCSAALVPIVGAEYAVAQLLPVLRALLADEGASHRMELAAELMQMARPLGAQLALSHVVPTTRLLLDDPCTSVRLSVVSRLGELVEVIGISDSDTSTSLLPLLESLCASTNWRVRHATLLLLPSLAQTLGHDAFRATFVLPRAIGHEARATDPCALIRTDWVEIVERIARLPG
jgi:hypothetical protein